MGGTWARSGLPPAESTWTYNAVNQLTAWDQTTVTYDPNGDLTQTSGEGTTVTYTWNARQQLVGISGGGTTASFAYDGLGRRISKTVNSASTQFVYDGLNPVQGLSGGSPVANLLPGLGIDEFISRTEGGTTSTFLTDGLGSTLALTDGMGTIQTEYTYDPFGMATVTGTGSTNSYQYTGREHDGTGLLYYRARYYSPVIQRFISEDPIGFAGGDPNLYGYVGNSPINFTDPIGLWVVGGGGSGSGGAWGVLDGAGGVVSDGVNVDSYAYAGGSSGPQFAATAGGTGIVAPLANSIYDIQGPSFDFHIRISAQLTISVPMNFNLRNTTFAFDTPGIIAFGLGWGIGYTKIGPPGGPEVGPVVRGETEVGLAAQGEPEVDLEEKVDNI